MWADYKIQELRFGDNDGEKNGAAAASEAQVCSRVFLRTSTGAFVLSVLLVSTDYAK